MDVTTEKEKEKKEKKHPGTTYLSGDEVKFGVTLHASRTLKQQDTKIWDWSGNAQEVQVIQFQNKKVNVVYFNSLCFDHKTAPAYWQANIHEALARRDTFTVVGLTLSSRYRPCGVSQHVLVCIPSGFLPGGPASQNSLLVLVCVNACEIQSVFPAHAQCSWDKPRMHHNPDPNPNEAMNEAFFLEVNYACAETLAWKHPYLNTTLL